MLLLLLCGCTAVTKDCGCPPPGASEGLVASWLASPTVGVGPHLLLSLHELGWQVRTHMRPQAMCNRMCACLNVCRHHAALYHHQYFMYMFIHAYCMCASP